MGAIRNDQMCSRCRNHNIRTVLKGHKRSCQFLTCNCERCSETKVRQKFIASEIAIHRKQYKYKNPRNVLANFSLPKMIPESKSEIRRNQMCARCKNHGIDQPLRGHKNSCGYAQCSCSICRITSERQKIMAKQIKDYRQTKYINDDSEMSMQDDSCGHEERADDSSESEVILPTLVEIKNMEASSRTVSNSSTLSTQPSPHILEKFYKVQSLYEKFILTQPYKQFQLIYAFVILAQDNWSNIESALQEGKNIRT
jgi:DM DNA binding domain